MDHSLLALETSAPPTGFRWRSRCVIAGSGLMLASLVAFSAAAEPPPPDKGSIGADGKFIPVPGAIQPSAPMSREDAMEALRKDFKVEQSAPGKLKIGLVVLEQASRSIRFRATVNMVEGPVEYALVATKGKVHESIFATNASVRDIHLAMLLLGVKPSDPANAGGNVLKIPDDSAIRVTVEWETNGPLASYPLSSMIALATGSPDQITHKTLSDGNWLYKGSGFDAGGFVALREGSIVSLIGDDMALINNPGEDREHDDLHVPNKALLPSVGMPVTIVITRALPVATP